MDQKPPIQLDYQAPTTRPIGIPDGYLGHRATEEELEETPESDYQPIQLGLLGWSVVAVLTPIVFIWLCYLLFGRR